MRAHAIALLAMLAASSCSAKSHSNDVAADACSAGTQRACRCPDGIRTGTQTCDGASFGACDGCPVIPSGGAQAQTGSGGTTASGNAGSNTDPDSTGNAANGMPQSGMPQSGMDAGNHAADAGQAHADAAQAHADAGDAGHKPASHCGNGKIDVAEECDGPDLNGATCALLNMQNGVLTCDPKTCTYDTSLCTPMCTTFRLCTGR